MPAYKPAAERFWPRVDKNGPVLGHAPHLGPCWVWTGGLNAAGYGQFSIRLKNNRAHRWAYEQLVGPIPDGLELDHLCCNRTCVRPDHLEPVTREQHARRNRNARKTHCANGHPYDVENTYVHPDGRKRKCRTCHRARQAVRRAQLARQWKAAA